MAVVLGSGQISQCVVKKTSLNLNLEYGGGGMHGQITNLALLQSPYYFITKEALISPGSKYDLSYWFLDAVLFGTKKLFTWHKMNFSEGLRNKLVVAYAKFILNTLQNRNLNCRNIDYPEIKDIKDKLLSEFKDIDTTFLEQYFIDINSKKSFKYKYGCWIYRLLSYIKGLFNSQFTKCLNKIG